MFEPSDRTRRKLAAQAAKLLEPGTVIRGTFLGRAQPRFTTPVIVTLSLFAAAFTVALALGVILIPGGILLLVLIQAIIPQRVVVVADRGVALLARSVLTGRPSKVLAHLPLSALPAGAGGQDRVPLGPDQIAFSGRERDRLVAAGRTPIAR